MFTTWNSPFVDDSSTIPAAFLNQVRIDLGRSIDAAGGSDGVDYTPLTAIQIGGAGLWVSTDFRVTGAGTATFNGQVEVLGPLATFDEVSISDLEEMSVFGPITMADDDATISWRVSTVSIVNTNAIQTITVAQDDHIVPNGHTNDLDVRLNSTAPVPPANVALVVTRLADSSGGRSAIFKSEGGAILATIAPGGAGWAEFIFRGGAWQPRRWGGTTTVP